MPLSRSRLAPMLGAFAFSLAIGSACAQTAATTRLQGEIVAVDQAVLRIRTPAGQVTPIAIDKARVTQRVPMHLEDVKSGVFLGTTATPQPDGTLLASEVHLFPDDRRGTGEGHRPMGNDGRSTMTNATVKEAHAVPTMTNATVSGVTAAPGSRIIKLTYKGGEQTVVVPATTPVVLSKESDRSVLKPGEHVIAYVAAGADGAFVAERVSVGVNGSVPPI